MSSSNAALAAFLAVLYCSSQVQSYQSTKSKHYTYGNDLIVSKESFREKSLLFTVCGSVHRGLAQCTMTFKSDVFDRMIQEQVCEITVAAQLSHPELFEFTEAKLWGDDKAILAWREISTSDSENERVTLRTVNLTSCVDSDYVLFTNARLPRRQRTFITPVGSNYEVSFYNVKECGNKYCKVIVDENGDATNVIPWISNTDSLYSVQPIEEGKLLISIGHFTSNRVKFSLLRKSKSQTLMEFDKIRDVGWSVSNGLIGICSLVKCKQFDKRGKVKAKLKFQPGHLQISEFIAMYNLPHGELLAVICEDWDLEDTENDYYRITKIGRDGRQGRSLDITDLNCSSKPNFIYMEFYQNNDLYYCLLIFRSTDYPLPEKRSKFTEFCFTLDEFY